MKTIISLTAIVAMVAPCTVFPQSSGESPFGEAVQTTGAQAGNNQNRQSRISKVNDPAVLGYGGGGSALAGTGYSYDSRNGLTRYPGTGQRPLVIHTSDMSPKDEANLEEDLAVMAHILDKSLEELPSGPTHTHTAMGIDLFVTPNPGALRSIYLEEYGALFLLNVGFPLIAPPSSAQEEKPSADSTWEAARQELYGQPGEPQAAMAPGEEFSEQKVSRLKETLLRALKNAANIRGLQGNITICIQGGIGASPAPTAAFYRRLGASTTSAVGQLLFNSAEAAPSNGTVLTIKVSKADVDAFAKGELKFAEFQKHARVAVYTMASAPGKPFGADGYGTMLGSARRP